ncbi:MAG: hypothetical protein NTU44_18895 [Bacteroidetes bacterium]|nr:hypothetical protein [Bacteroidota bacterium]
MKGFNLTVSLPRSTFAFLLCLLISVSLWLFIKLLGNFTADIPVIIKYHHYPSGKSLLRPVDSIVNIEVESQGFELLTILYFTKKITIPVDLRKYETAWRDSCYYIEIPTAPLLPFFTRELPLTGNINRIHPDTMRLGFDYISFKKIPVKVNISVRRKDDPKQWKLMIDPDSVIVTGPSLYLSKVAFATARELQINKPSGDKTWRLDLERPAMHGVKYSHGKVSVYFVPEKDSNK